MSKILVIRKHVAHSDDRRKCIQTSLAGTVTTVGSSAKARMKSDFTSEDVVLLIRAVS